MSSDSEKKLLSTHEAAQQLGYTHDYIARMCRTGKLKALRVGTSWCIEPKDLHEFHVAHQAKLKAYREELAASRKMHLSGAVPVAPVVVVAPIEEEAVKAPAQVVEKAPVSVPSPYFDRTGVIKRVAVASLVALIVVTGASSALSTNSLRVGFMSPSSVLAAAPRTNFFEDLALATYEGMHNLFGTTGGVLARLFLAQVAYAPNEADLVVGDGTATAIASVVGREQIIQNIYNSYYVSGVTKEYLDERVGYLMSRQEESRLRHGSTVTSNSTSGGSGSVTSVDVSGGVTGLTFTGGPITSSGTLTLSGTLAIANGGTGSATAPTYGQLLIGDGAGGYTLVATSTLGIIGAASSPGGSDSYVQYNNGGVFGGAAAFTFDDVTGRVTMTYASTTALSANSLCLGSDCRTTWPTVGSAFGYPFVGNATSTTLTFNGGLLSVGSTTINGSATTTGTQSVASLYINSELFSDLTGSGLQNIGGALTLNATGDWTGTFDGQEGSYYLANGFSTTSANYWETQQTARTADDLTNNSIEDLNDVAAMSKTFGDLFYWNGSTWTDIATSSLGLESALTFSTPLSRTGNTVSILQANGSQSGYLSAADWNIFNNKISSTSLSATYPLAYNASTGVISQLWGTTTANTWSAHNTFSSLFATNASTTNATTTNFGINAETFTDLTGTGLQNVSGVLTLNATGDWSGTFDGQEGSYYIANSFSSTSAAYYLSQNPQGGFSTTSAQYFVHSSTTIPKTYGTNTFTGSNVFNGGLTIGTLNGPLHANNGVVSATTSIGVLYGGTGLTVAPTYGQVLVGNSSGGYTLTATSSLGLGAASQWGTDSSDGIYYNGNIAINTTDASSTQPLYVRSTVGIGSEWAPIFYGVNSTGFQNAFQVRVKDNITDLAADYLGSSDTNLTFSTRQDGLPLTEQLRIDATGDVILTGGGTLTLNTGLNGPLQANNGVVSATTSVGAIYGGTGQTGYAVGDLLYADSATSLARLPVSSNGLVLKLVGGVPSWQPDLTTGGGGGAGAWSTTTNSLAIYPSDTSDVVIIGAAATTTSDSILEVFGRSYFSNTVGIGSTSPSSLFRLAVQGGGLFSGNIGAANITATGTITGVNGLFTSATTTNFGINNETFTDLTGSGLQNISGVLSVNTSGDWTGTFDGQEGSYYLNRANHTGTQLAATISDFNAAVNSYIHSSTTIPKTYTSNTFTAAQTFNGGLTVGTLSGVIYGNNGSLTAAGTSTPTLGLGLSYSGTLGSFVGGVSGSFTVATSSLYTGTQGQVAYFDGTNSLIGTSSLFIGTNQNVGIGTTTPEDPLSIVRPSGSNGTILSFGQGGGFSHLGYDFDITTSGNGSLDIYGKNSNTNRFQALSIVRNSGWVGFGTTTPYSRVSVWGSGTTNSQLFSLVNNASTTIFQALDNGNIGIGTTSPYAKLSVVGEVVGATFTATTTGTSTLPTLAVTNLGIGTDYLTDVTGSGLQIISGVLSVNTTGDWTGTFDGQEGSYYLANGFSTTSAQYFVHSSTTIPKTYTSNTFTAANTFNGGLTVGTLNGPLQANNGVVSATTSVGVLYGGTGLTTAPTYGQLLVGNSSGGYTLTATSSLGMGTVGSGTAGQISYYAANGTNTVGTSTVFITPAGDVGIGNTGPTNYGNGFRTLAIDDTTSGVLDIMFNGIRQGTAYNSGSTFRVGNASPNDFALITGDTEQVIINSAGNVTLLNGSLVLNTGFNGPLQANNGVVSATTSIGVLYGGTGLTTAPTYGQLLVGNSSGGYTLTATSSLGLPTFAYPFPNNATSTTLTFNGGLLSVGSTTINGNATTTGDFSAGGVFTVRSGGNVGVGTTSPTTALVIQGSGAGAVQIGEYGLSNAFGAISLNGRGLGASDYNFTSSYTDPNLYINRPTNRAIRFREGNVDQVAIATGGNVGIGTTSPYAKLSVAGETVAQNFTATSTTAVNTFPLALFTSATTTNFGLNAETFTDLTGLGLSDVGGALTVATSSLYTGTTGQVPYFSGTNQLVGTSSLNISTAGNIGIGAAPAAGFALDVTGIIRSVSGNLVSTNSAGNATMSINSTGGNAFLRLNDASTQIFDLRVVDNTNRFDIFDATDSEIRFSIDTSGNVGIGTTSPYAKLSVVGQAVAEYFTATSTTATSTFPLAQITSALRFGADYLTDITGTGLQITNNALTLNATGDWTGTFDGQEGSYYLNRANHTGTQLAATISDFNAAVNSYIHSSTTIPKTYTSNTFTANQTFNNGVTIGTLNGPLQANNGVVSATTSIGVLYGGTGLTTAPTYGQLLVGNSSGGYTLTATSSLGLATAFTATYPIQYSGNVLSLAFGTSTSNTWGGTQTFTNAPILGTLTGVIYGNNGTLAQAATSTPTLGLGLSYSGTLGSFVGGASGSLTVATSSLYTGTTGQVPYFSGTNTITATSSLFVTTSGDIGIGTTTPNADLTVQGLNGISLANASGAVFATLNGQNTNANSLTFNQSGVTGSALGDDNWTVFRYNGSTNKIFLGDTGTTALINTNHNLNFAPGAGASTTTAPAMTLLTTGNVGIGSSTPVAKFSVQGTAAAYDDQLVLVSSSTAAFATTTHFSVLASGNVGIGTANPSTNLHIQTTSAGSSPALSLENDARRYSIYVNGSSADEFTVRDNNVGLNRFVLDSGGKVGIGTTTPTARLGVHALGTDTFASRLFTIASSTAAFATSTHFTVLANGNVGIGTTTPGTTLAIQGVANFSTATSTFSGTGGLDLRNGGCYAVNGTCLSLSTLGGTVGLANGGTATTTFYNGGVVYSDGTKLTQAGAVTDFYWDETNNRLALGTTAPTAQFSIAGNQQGTSPILSISTSSITSLLVSRYGFTGIGTTSPHATLSITGMYTASTTDGDGNDAALVISARGATGNAAVEPGSGHPIAGKGGGYRFQAGAGGVDNNAGVWGIGGDGGHFDFIAGAGGNGSTGQFGPAYGGDAGNFTFTGATGGGTNGDAGVAGGAGSSFTVTAGNGGAGAASGVGGAGGAITLTSGNGGSVGAGGTRASGGNITLAPGSGLTPGNIILASTRGNVAIGTSAPAFLTTIASSTAPQLALSAGAGFSQWTFRNSNGTFYLATSSAAGGTATSTVSALSISGNGTTTVLGLAITGGATTTAANGINLSSGCYAINGSCLGVNTLANGNTGTTTFYNGGVVYSDGTKLTQATGSGNSTFAWDNTNGRLGLGTSTPWAQLSVNPNGLGTAPAFAIGSSTRTLFLVNNNGNVGIGTSSAQTKLAVNGNLLLEGTGNYLNFGTTTGTTGYGFRDNGGQMEFKNINGGWNQISFATTGPTFKVNKGGTGQTVTDAVEEDLTWSVEEFDTNENFDLSTGRFTPTVPGKYLITLVARCTTTGRCGVHISKNGTSILFMTNPAGTGSGGTSPTAMAVVLVDMNGSTDYVSGSVIVSGGTSVSGQTQETHFSGTMVTPINNNQVAGWTNDGVSTTMLDTADLLGVGTTSPWGKVSIQGTANQTNPIFQIGSSSVNTSFLTIAGSNGFAGYGSTTPWAQLSINPTATNGAAPAFAIGSSTATRFVVTNAGNVGIGTSTPGTLLSIQGVANFSAATTTFQSTGGLNLAGGGCYAVGGTCLSLTTLGGTLGLANGGTATTTFYNGGVVFSDGTKLTQAAAPASFFWDNTNARLGLGTTTPYSKLSVWGSGTTNGQLFSLVNNASTTVLQALDNGNVGIGTTTPQALLHVNSSAAASGSGTEIARFSANAAGLTTGSGPYLNFTTPTGIELGRIYSIAEGVSSQHGLAFYTLNSGGSAERLRISGTGNIGIGTTTPYAKLSVAGQVVADNFTATSTTATSTFAGGIAGPNSFVVQQSTGNVGIGTTTPLTQLSIVRSSGSTGTILSLGQGGGFSHLGYDFDITTSGNGSLDLYGKNSNTSRFHALSIVRNSGWTGFGTTTPYSRLSVWGSGTGTGQLFSLVNNASTTVLQALDNGNIGIGTSSPAAKLFIEGTVANSNTGQGIVLAASDSAIPAPRLAIFPSGNGSAVIQTLQNGSLLFANSSGQFSMTIMNSTGNVGIGSTSPYAKLSIAGETVAQNFTATSTTATSTFAGGIAGPNSFVVQQTSGNVGIGTSSPGSLLSINNIGNFTTGTSTLYTGLQLTGNIDVDGVATSTFSNGINIASGCFAINNVCFSGGGSGGVGAGTTGQFGYYAANGTDLTATSTLFLAANSNIGIGTTTPNAKLAVYGDMLLEGSGRYLNFGTVSGTTGYGIRDNGGVMEFKNNGGSWSQFTSATSGPTIQVSRTGGTQSITAGVATKLDIDTEDIDSNNNFDTTTDRFTPTVPGKYLVYFRVSSLGADQGRVQSFIYKNGVDIGVTSGDTGSGTGFVSMTSQTQMIVDMNGTTDYIEGYASSTATNLVGGSMSATLIAPINSNSVAGWTNDGIASYLLDNNDYVGIGTSSPWGKLSISATGLGASPAFAIGSTSPGGNFVVTNGGFVGIGTSSPYAQFALQSTAGYTGQILDIASSTGASYLHMTYNGRLGIGTSSPMATLAVQTNNSGSELNPAFVVATTSAWGPGQRPLIYAIATTTGKLDFARVAIGTTSPWGTAGLRDQFTVDGRIYSTWRYAACDFAGSSLVTTLTADTLNFCGQFMYDFQADSTLGGVSSYPPYAHMSAGAVAPALNDGAQVRMGSMVTSATTSPVMEAWVQVNPVSTATVTPLYIVGMYGTATNTTAIATLPTNGVYFAATSTQNWYAVSRRNSVETWTNTNISTSTTNFQKMRVEVNDLGATFLINGNVVAQHGATTIPQAYITPGVLVAVASTGAQAGTGFPRINISLIRFWMDDPPGGLPLPEGIGMYEDVFDPVQGADIAEAYIADGVLGAPPGLILANSTTTNHGVRFAQGVYDEDITGVITTSPHAVMGDEASTTIRVGLVGRVPVIVSDQNGPIKKGDRITSSNIAGIGMKALRPGAIVGRALTDFDPEDLGSCNALLKDELIAAGIPVPEDACVAEVMVMLKPGFDMGIGALVQDATSQALGVAEALAELSNASFAKGAELTKFVVGQLTAKIAVVDKLFASVFTVLPGGDINLPAGDDQVAGWSILPAGETTFVVENAKAKEGSRILITPRALIASPLVVTSIEEGVGFTVQTLTPSDTDVPFDWLIINTYGDETPAELIEPPTEEPPAEEPPEETPPEGGGEEPPAEEPPADEPPPEVTPPEEEPPAEEPPAEEPPAEGGEEGGGESGGEGSP